MLKDTILTGWLLGAILMSGFFALVLVLVYLQERRERKKQQTSATTARSRKSEAEYTDSLYTSPVVEPLNPLRPSNRTMHDAPKTGSTNELTRRMDVRNQIDRRRDV